MKTSNHKINNILYENISLADISFCKNLANKHKRGREFYSFFNHIRKTDNICVAFENFINFFTTTTLRSSQFLYNLTFVSLKYNVSIDEADEIINLMKQNKTTNLKGFILRHGEIEGKKKFEEFRKTSKKSSDKVKILNKDEQLAFYRNNSRRCFEFYITRELAKTINEAKQMVSEYQQKTAGVNRLYYQNLGLSESDIADIMLAVNPKKATGYKQSKIRYPDSWQERMEARHKKVRKTLGCPPVEDLPKIDNYYREVNKFTTLSCLLYPEKIKDLEKRSVQYHLDHRYSKFFGYKNNIPPEVIGHYMNLRIISQTENTQKRQNCSITIEDLYLLIEEEKNENKENNS